MKRTAKDPLDELLEDEEDVILDDDLEEEIEEEDYDEEDYDDDEEDEDDEGDDDDAEEGDDEAETPLTMSTLMEALDKRDAEIMRRTRQSSNARDEFVRQEMEKMKTYLSSIGTPLPKAAEGKLQQEISDKYDQALAEDGGQVNLPGGPVAQQQHGGDPLQVVVQQSLLTAFKEVGVEVDPDDPEAIAIKEYLDRPDGNPQGLAIVAARQALKKRRRLARQSRTKGARSSPKGGRPLPASKVRKVRKTTDSDELYDMAFQEEFGTRKK